MRQTNNKQNIQNNEIMVLNFYIGNLYRKVNKCDVSCLRSKKENATFDMYII